MSDTRRWQDKPSTWIGAGLAAIVVVALFTPSADIRGTVPQLSSYSAAPGGARGLSEVARHLGWKVTRSTSKQPPHRGSAAVYAVLDPAIPLTRGEVSELLSRVRAGGALLIVAERKTPLADSLGVQVGFLSGSMPWDSTNTCPPRRRFVLSAPLWDVPAIGTVRHGPATTHTFLALEGSWIGSPGLPVVLGFELGRGRVGVVSDPLLLSNAVLKECRFPAGLAVAALLQYLGESPPGSIRSELVFDEFHQGYGVQPSVGRVTSRMLLASGPGRGLLQMALAGVILLTAIAPRPVSPRKEAVPQRRSPLEHVRALAAAYQEVGATRTATRRLVGGLRRRLARGSSGANSDGDETFLRELAAAHPNVAAEVDRVLHSLANRTTTRELVATGESIHRIERLLARDSN